MDDVKSNLILTALSWVDYLKPKHVYFENVPGFLRFSFDAEQAGLNRVEGGIHMGGMKFIVRALIDLGYVNVYSTHSAPHRGLLTALPDTRSDLVFYKQAITGLPKVESGFSLSRLLRANHFHNFRSRPTISKQVVSI